MGEYKWYVYTADIKFEYNKPYIKWFKKHDNWIEHECSITDFKYKGHTISTISNSYSRAYDKILEFVNNNPNYIAWSDRKSVGFIGRYKTRNRVIKIRKMEVTMQELFRDYDAEKVIEYLKERGINMVHSS